MSTADGGIAHASPRMYPIRFCT